MAPVSDYAGESMSSKVVKIIRSYTDATDKTVWRKGPTRTECCPRIALIPRDGCTPVDPMEEPDVRLMCICLWLTLDLGE